ncbi:MAG: NAD(P)-dependent alcohol dehydrogenase [Burkholderiales bacterium]|nr:NAD(P)-dependent alcohol dehydrogenase [Burkholderiales bacterium]
MQRYELAAVTGLDSLTRVERDVPRPGPGQVLIRTTAWSLNYRDLLVAGGRYGPPRAGCVPLSDGVGVIEEVGAGVTRVAVGDRVAGIFMQGWIAGDIPGDAGNTALGGAIDGMLSEYVVLSAEGVVKVPAHLTDAEAASLPCAAVTAWNALVRESGIRAGDTVVLLGTGGVSLIALQFAKLHGATTIVTSSSDAKLDIARRLGADHTVNYRAQPDWDRAVLDITNGRGADIVVEVGGPGTFDKSLAALRPGGHLPLIGVLTGVNGAVSTAAILRKHIRVHGIYVGSREMFDEMNRAIAASGLRPPVDRNFGFDDARAAYEHLERAAHAGKVTLTR